MKQLLLCFIAALLLMPSPLMADNAKKKIKTLDITMDMPTADMDLNAGEELALKSVQTAYGGRPFQERRHFAHVNLLGRRVWREQR